MLIELLRSAAERDGSRPVVLTTERTTTYDAAVAAAERFGAGLAASGAARVGVCVADPADVLALWTAASLVGVEACTLDPQLDDEGVARVAARFELAAVVTDRPRAAGDVRTLMLDELAASGEGAPTVTDPRATPLLVLTTGTTGEQKAARHDWSRLVSAVRGRRPDPDARWLLGYNLEQFAGVQLVLHVVATGGTLVAAPTRRPRDAPEVMRSLGVTHASATPTFWRFLLAGLDADAPPIALRQITLGGEAVPASLLDDLARAFPDARVSQIYASTEFGSSVSVRDRSHGLPLSVLERSDGDDVAFRVQDGELWARSRVGMLGYLGDDDAGDPDGWRPTGDLVEVRDDRLVFVGRVSDRINVGGVKVHPLPVEETVSAVPGVHLARAYGKANALTGQIVAVDVVADEGVDEGQLRDAIRAACAASTSLAPAAQPRLIRFVDEIDVRGNKIVRRAEAVAQ